MCEFIDVTFSHYQADWCLLTMFLSLRGIFDVGKKKMPCDEPLDIILHVVNARIPIAYINSSKYSNVIYWIYNKMLQ